MASQADFDSAVERVKGLPSKPDNNTLLELYSLYKQATVGDVSGKRPGMLDLAGRAKYDAWTQRKGMAADGARDAYVALVNRLAGG